MRSTARRVGVVFASLVLAGVSATVAAPTAFAGSDEQIVTSKGSVGWQHSGDKVTVCDAKKDGLSVEVNYRLAGDTTPGRVLHVAGAGNCDSRVWDKTEGADIEIRMCYRDNIVVTECSGWQKAEA